MRNNLKAFVICAILLLVGCTAAGIFVSSVSAQVQIPINIVSTTWVTLGSDGSTYIQIDGCPGDSRIPLRVKIQSIGNATISGINAIILLDPPFTNTTGGNICSSFYSGSMSPGSDALADFLVNINLNAKPGEYKLRMTFNYLEQATGVGKTLQFLKSVDALVPVVVSTPRTFVIYDVVLVPLSTVAGGNITIAGTVLNTGRISALNTNISITTPAVTRGSILIVGQVDPNVPRPFSSRMQLRGNLAPGVYPVTVIATFGDSNGVGHVVQIQLRVTVNPPEPPRPITSQRPTGIVGLLIQIVRDILAALFGLTTLVAS